ncbi:hypothetical protein [Herbaspirillum sp. SJZ107]|uniref:hypothetical protein n=1 Tax=Herbaspirillum sp. SJZ107 TaxID=2572881 RepID=UPI00114F92A1|nr:hypothetical protein [Herbaspirillum sp. SJZ107]TQK10662.1 hypothetical protein FBX97_0581 [Herbaspirillum sp. SJZ107]
MTASHSSCNCIVLSAGPAGQVLACPECGTIHLHLSQLTLRLDPDGFSELSVIVAKAQHLLDEARTRLAAKAERPALH